jgi:GNAT superfamily N-acetyltransferase
MVSTPAVRAALPDDAEAFAACHLECWREAYGELWGHERFAGMDVEKMAVQRRKQIEDGTATHALAEADGEVVAVAISGPPRDDDAPAPQELYASYVRKAYQGSGVADALLQATIGDRPATLWVYRDNPRATAFYVNHGFIPDGSERTDSEGILEIRMLRNGNHQD